MLCHRCRVHLRRDFPYCLHCGALRRGAKVETFEAPVLRFATEAGRRDGGPAMVPLTRPVMTIGRSSDADVLVDHPSVSRRHAQISRTADGFLIEDLGSLNGVTVRGNPVLGRKVGLADGVAVTVGDVPMVFEQLRNTKIGSRTMVVGPEQTVLANPETGGPTEPAQEATEPLSQRPRRRSGWALKKVPSLGAPAWVLRNTRTGSYLELDERDVFVWNLLDGRNTIRDLLFEFADRYGELALPRIEAALREFARAELVTGLHGQRSAPDRPAWRRAGQAVLRTLLRTELTIGKIDKRLGRWYRRWGWRYFTRTGVTALGALIVAGGYAFVAATGSQRLFDTAGAGPVGAVAVLAGYLVATVIHELAHALAVKSYGRSVRRAGFMVTMGMPFAFVDTSDMWFGSGRSRIVVALSGPLTTLGLAGAASIGAAYLEPGPAPAILFQLAFGLYVNTLFNLNPMMPLDGYQALADALRMPKLREEALGYLTKGLWQDLRARRRPAGKRWGLMVYAAGSMAITAVSIPMALVAWNGRLGEFVERHLDPPMDTLAVVAGLGVVFFPIWYRLSTRIGRLVRRRARAGRIATEGTA